MHPRSAVTSCACIVIVKLNELRVRRSLRLSSDMPCYDLSSSAVPGAVRDGELQVITCLKIWRTRRPTMLARALLPSVSAMDKLPITFSLWSHSKLRRIP